LFVRATLPRERRNLRVDAIRILRVDAIRI